jgi:xanthine dehydrogenase accessory factor
MRRIAALVETWRAQGRDGVLARSIEAQGLGPRPNDDVLLVDDHGAMAGSLLGGVVNERVVAAGRQLLGERALGHVIVDADVAFDDATAVGLTCGGQVNVLIQRLADIPVQLWDELAAGRPAALVTRIGDGAGMLVVRPGGAAVGSLGLSGLDTLAAAEAEPLLQHPGASSTRVVLGDVEVVIEGWNPVPRLVIVGPSTLAEALRQQAELLGWQATTTVTAAESLDAVEQLTRADMAVVLDHDPNVATPVLATALRRGVGYVGALGSRRTQEARRRALETAGVTDAEMAGLHGPTGLDLGARTPAETAVSIVAEIIAARSGRDARALREATSRITS